MTPPEEVRIQNSLTFSQPTITNPYTFYTGPQEGNTRRRHEKANQLSSAFTGGDRVRLALRRMAPSRASVHLPCPRIGIRSQVWVAACPGSLEHAQHVVSQNQCKISIRVSALPEPFGDTHNV